MERSERINTTISKELKDRIKENGLKIPELIELGFDAKIKTSDKNYLNDPLSISVRECTFNEEKEDTVDIYRFPCCKYEADFVSSHSLSEILGSIWEYGDIDKQNGLKKLDFTALLEEFNNIHKNLEITTDNILNKYSGFDIENFLIEKKIPNHQYTFCMTCSEFHIFNHDVKNDIVDKNFHFIKVQTIKCPYCKDTWVPKTNSNKLNLDTAHKHQCISCLKIMSYNHQIINYDNLFSSISDHIKFFEFGVVFQPYDSTQEDMEKLLEISKILNYKIKFTGLSEHHNRCFSIICYKLPFNEDKE